MPDKRAEKPYALLVEAMRRSNKVAIARFVLRTKQYLAALRPLEAALVLSTLYFADEVTEVSNLEGLPGAEVELSDKEIAMAEQLIESLAAKFDPDKFHDEYREQVMELIEQKAEGQEIVAQPVTEAPTAVVDLMAALEASLAKGRQGEAKRRRASADRRVDVGGRQLTLSNLDKVMYPASGFTKGQVIEYYAKIAAGDGAAPGRPADHVEALPERRRRHSSSTRRTAPSTAPTGCRR